MSSDRLESVFSDGGFALGFFDAELTLGEQSEIVGALSWDKEDGAMLRTLFDGESPDRVGTNVDVAGLLETGDPIFIPAGLVTRSGVATRSTETIVGSRLIVGVAEDAMHGWTRSGLETHNLHEWWPETGIVHDHGDRSAPDGTVLSTSWQPPPSREIAMTWGKIQFAITAPISYAYAPDWHLETRLRISARFDEPRTISEIDRDFVTPIVALSAFATDHPDAPKSYSIFRDGTLANVLDRRDPLVQRDWHPGREMLFSEADVDSFDALVTSWFKFFFAFRPVAIAMLDSINEGNLFTAARLQGLVTALEAFHRTKYERDPDLIVRLKELRSSAGVADCTWCSDRNLDLIVSARNYFSHLEGPRRGFSEEQVIEGVVPSTRRALALLQASMLTELGFAPEWILGPLEASLCELAAAAIVSRDSA